MAFSIQPQSSFRVQMSSGGKRPLAADPKQLALQAISRALVDPTPKVMQGSKGKPCFFEGSSAALKQAAVHCLENRWVEGTGVFVGTGKSKKELFQVTPAG